MSQAPLEVRRRVQEHSELINMPIVGADGNYGYGTVQFNLAPEQEHGSGTKHRGSI